MEKETQTMAAPGEPRKKKKEREFRRVKNVPPMYIFAKYSCNT